MKRKDIKVDEYSYASCEDYKPQEYELVHLIDEKDKHYQGWWNGNEWFCYKLKPGTNFVKWKYIT